MYLEMERNGIGLKEKTADRFVFKLESDSGEENHVINLYPEIQYEAFENFGGAITEASGYVYSMMDDRQKKELLHTYFTETGMNYKIVRIHMDSCDFCLGEYEADADEADALLTNFNLERTEKYIFPLLEDAQKTAGVPLEIMLSPWSPPKYMKTDAKRTGGGSLKPEYRRRWAEYICRYIEEFQKRGYQIKRLSAQNEPNARTKWDSCFYTAEQEQVFVRDFLIPAMREHKLEEVELFIWDHNKERVYERAAAIIDETTDSFIKGIAFHWYTGDHFESLRLIRERFPDKKLILSESCLEFYKFDQEHLEDSAQAIAHEILGNMNEGMSSFYDWNILLDETGGPNHVQNLCHAFFMYHRDKKELVRQPALSYYFPICHSIAKGDRRIAFSRYTDQLELTAYLKASGEIIVLLLNRSNEKLPVIFRVKGQAVRFEAEAKALLYCKIKE